MAVDCEHSSEVSNSFFTIDTQFKCTVRCYLHYVFTTSKHAYQLLVAVCTVDLLSFLSF